MSLSAQASEICPRFGPGSLVATPQELRSEHDKLRVELSFRSYVDAYGLTRYCYLDGDGAQAPTLRVKPGDEVVISLRNDIRAASQVHTHEADARACAAQMAAGSTNLHFHGLEIPPLCHQDEVLHTLVAPGDAGFEYRFRVPRRQSPGLYWYHPHPHGFTDAQVLGGASGALIVEGIERARPETSGLAERVLILRDQLRSGQTSASDEPAVGPAKDISLNFVPVAAPLMIPAVMRVRPDERELWRVLNASADTYFDVQLLYTQGSPSIRVPQLLELIAVDGAPMAAAMPKTSLLIPPGGRAEFLIRTPPAGAFAQFVTRGYDTGPDGERNPARVIANIVSRADASAAASRIPSLDGHSSQTRFEDSTHLAPTHKRKLYFSEDRQDLTDPAKSAKYFITLEGAAEKVFAMDAREPDITVEEGSVEDWTIENRAREAHTFHIHQLHFQMLARDGQPENTPIARDTIDLPYWDGKSPHYPSVTLRLDFRAPEIVGTFVYHCHLLEHEDSGMMGSIRVTPR